jgi:hypothetical protein
LAHSFRDESDQAPQTSRGNFPANIGFTQKRGFYDDSRKVGLEIGIAVGSLHRASMGADSFEFFAWRAWDTFAAAAVLEASWDLGVGDAPNPGDSGEHAQPGGIRL